MKDEFVLLFLLILVIVNLKWMFFSLLYPFMVINARNRNKKCIYKIFAAPYLVSEKIFDGG